jgi:hypothetical protein
MMTCGLCGSGVCADEKFKKLKKGLDYQAHFITKAFK